MSTSQIAREAKLKVEVLRSAALADLSMRTVAGESGFDRVISWGRIQRPGLAFAGFLAFIKPGRIQILGESELNYLDTLPRDVRRERIASICALPVAAFVVTKGQQAPDDPNAIAFYLEAWMPEAVAVHKLRGFVHDAKGEVVQSVPGLIRVRLGGQGSRYRFRSRRKSWFDLAPKSGLTDMALYMEQAGPSASLLHITVQMRSRDGVPASDEDFQAHCNEVFVDLRGYLMAQNLDLDDSNS